MIKLTFSTLACPAWTLEQIFSRAKEYGYQGVDFRGLLADVDITKSPDFDANLDRTIDLCRQNGLEMPCLNTSVTMVTPEPDRWDAMLAETQRYARIAGKAETRFLRVFGGAIPKGMTREEAVVLSQRHLRQVSKICQAHRCIPVLETHDAWTITEHFRPLLEGFDPGEAGVLWDLEHPFHNGEAPRDTAEGLKRFILYVHVKDSLEHDGKALPKLMGEGHVPVKESCEALKAIGYEGWYCLEAEKRWYPQDCPEPEITLPQYVTYMRALEKKLV